MLLLVGFGFGLAGYWVCGFAVQTGGVGDARAALISPLPAPERGALDDELGVKLGGHHWGLMGSAGFFLVTDDSTREGLARLFLAQAVLVLITVAAALGAGLERARLPAMAAIAFVTGALIDPLIANWVWGGGLAGGTGPGSSASDTGSSISAGPGSSMKVRALSPSL